MSKIFFVLLTFISSMSFADNEWYEKGNGGFALQCPKMRLQTLDLFELKNFHKDVMTLDEEHQDDVKDRVDYLISKIERINPERAQRYRAWYATFDDETEKVANTRFDRLGDAGLVRIPNDCHLDLVVFRREPSILNKARYTVNKDLWDRLSPQDQAAMVMHELIYREFSASPNNHQTSDAARYFNGLVNSKELLTMSLEQYLTVLEELKVTSPGFTELSSVWTPKWDQLKAYWTMKSTVGAIAKGSLLPDYFGASNATSSGAGLFFGNENGPQGVTFDNSSYFEVPQSSPANVCDALTWMTWVKWKAPPAPEHATIITNWNDCRPDAGWNIDQAKGSQGIELSFNTTEGFNQWFRSETPVLDGTWHHIALTLTSAGAATYYVDGVPNASYTVSMGTGICSPKASMIIGGGRCGPFISIGAALSEMAIWNAPLTSSEISTVYKRQKTGF